MSMNKEMAELIVLKPHQGAIQILFIMATKFYFFHAGDQTQGLDHAYASTLPPSYIPSPVHILKSRVKSVLIVLKKYLIH